jgi:hypothetical protein
MGGILFFADNLMMSLSLVKWIISATPLEFLFYKWLNLKVGEKLYYINIFKI